MKIEIDIHNALSGGWQRKKICVRPLVLNNGYWDLVGINLISARSHTTHFVVRFLRSSS